MRLDFKMTMAHDSAALDSETPESAAVKRRLLTFGFGALDYTTCVTSGSPHLGRLLEFISIKHGVSHSDAYDWLNARTLEREARGDTRVSSMVLGVLGRSENGGELGRLFGVRSAGRSASEMAMAMDKIWSEDGQAPDYAMTPAESCQNPVLYRTFFVNAN